MTVRIQVIKVYEIDAPAQCEDPLAYANGLQTTDVEKLGRLVEAQTDYAEIVEDEKGVRG